MLGVGFMSGLIWVRSRCGSFAPQNCCILLVRNTGAYAIEGIIDAWLAGDPTINMDTRV